MRINSLSSAMLAMLALAIFVSAGCDNAATTPPKTNTDDTHDHDHSDPNSHASAADDHPAHGPYGGHIFPLDTKDYQCEWKKYKDNDVIKMYVLDAEGKKAAPIKADSFTVTPKIGNDGTSFTLEPEEADENGLTAVYSLDNKDLAIAIPTGVDVEFKVGDKTYKGTIKAHKPLDH